ncbi:MAG: replication factor C small subunit, partial [Nitrososphaera sp.]|nr:replication factor C small subunit [Nitrososphaera sp.]
MWVEKYRPAELDQVIDQKEIIRGLENLIKNPEEIPHLLFAGPAGVGKTTTALCVAKGLLGEEWQRDTLELNASDERGIKMVRERVKEFAAVMKLTTGNKEDNRPFRIIILDEADEMTSEAQTALRRIIEDSSRTTRFIIICNYLSQIIEPIQSRCVVFRFTRLTNEDIVSHLKTICQKEGVKYDDKALTQIYEATSGDLRHSINILQAAAGMGSDRLPRGSSADRVGSAQVSGTRSGAPSLAASAVSSSGICWLSLGDECEREGPGRLLGRHPKGPVEPDHLAVQHRVLGDLA